MNVPPRSARAALTSAALAALLLGISSGNGYAASSCPDGAIELRRETVGDTTRVYCENIENLSPAQAMTIDPRAVRQLSAVDRRRFQRMKGRAALPEIDPRVYATPEWLAYARTKLEDTQSKRARLMRQRAALDEMTPGLQQLARDNDDILRDLILDGISNTLTVIQSLARHLAAQGAVPAPLAVSLDASINASQAATNAVAARGAREDDHQIDKMVDSFVGFKNLLFNHPKFPVIPAAKGPLQNATSALYKSMKIVERHYVRGEPFNLKNTAASLDDAADAVGELELLPGLKETRATVHLAMGAAAMHWVEADIADIDKARAGNQTSKEFYDDRISRTDDFIDDYRRFVTDDAPRP